MIIFLWKLNGETKYRNDNDPNIRKTTGNRCRPNNNVQRRTEIVDRQVKVTQSYRRKLHKSPFKKVRETACSVRQTMSAHNFRTFPDSKHFDSKHFARSVFHVFGSSGVCTRCEHYYTGCDIILFPIS